MMGAYGSTCLVRAKVCHAGAGASSLLRSGSEYTSRQPSPEAAKPVSGPLLTDDALKTSKLPAQVHSLATLHVPRPFDCLLWIAQCGGVLACGAFSLHINRATSGDHLRPDKSYGKALRLDLFVYVRKETDEKILIGTGEGGGSGSTGKVTAGQGARRARGSRFQGARLCWPSPRLQQARCAHYLWSSFFITDFLDMFSGVHTSHTSCQRVLWFSARRP